MMLQAEKTLGPYQTPLDQLMTYRLSRVYAQLNAQAARVLRESSGLSQVQWRVLVMLDSFGEISANRIVQQLIIDKGQLSRTLKSMVKDGLILVRENETDSRSSKLSMTEKGRALFEQSRPAMQARQEALNAHLTDEERRVFLSTLRKLEAAIREFDPEDDE